MSFTPKMIPQFAKNPHEQMRYEDFCRANDMIAAEWLTIYKIITELENGTAHYSFPIVPLIQRKMSMIGQQLDRLSTRTILEPGKLPENWE